MELLERPEAIVVANFLVAFATLALALAAFKQISASRQQVQASREQVSLAIAAVAAAERSTSEAVRARIDARAHKVVAVMGPPMWPPLLHQSLTHMPGGGEPTLFDSINIHGSKDLGPQDTLVFPRDERQLLWFRGSGLLINEGTGTAFVHLPSVFRLSLPSEVSHHSPGLVGSPPTTGEFGSRIVLRPGDSISVEWAAGNALGDWADAFTHPNPPNQKGAVFFEIIVSDTLAESVTDNIFLVLAGRPVEPVKDQHGAWRLASEPHMVMSSYPTTRRRRGVDEMTIEPPWLVTYSREDSDGATTGS